MGYSLTIGELVVEYDNEDDCPYIGISAKSERHDDAPAFGEPTDHTNERWPSYTVWDNFCKTVGLHDLFFDKTNRDDALISSHPGCIPLTERHRKEVNDALAAWKEKYPNATPTFGKPAPDNLKGVERMTWSDPDNPDENQRMTRLVWLHYWVNWALDNCKQPVFANS